ncbi:hypothetical protein NE237_021610 [Protea cynaroides]|uniref:Uncharacterized protein n=1 Tax=Protea cynaroides TaxID=273540 RepID=A0A9Q0K4I3_9MAGN|nr:hypothetical protein NE237_021610 [Protea cynaroides]
MDGRGGCCIARYAGGAYDMSTVDRIMLRFWPIAPKLAVGGHVAGSCSTRENNHSVFRAGRAKRRYVRDNNKRCNWRRRVLPKEKKDGLDDTTVVTLLPLLPEIPDQKETPSRKSPSDLDLKASTTVTDPI